MPDNTGRSSGVIERTQITYLPGKPGGFLHTVSTRRVCYQADRSLTGDWAKDRAAHRCDLDAGHSGEHHDDCCEHGVVTWA